MKKKAEKKSKGIRVPGSSVTQATLRRWNVSKDMGGGSLAVKLGGDVSKEREEPVPSTPTTVCLVVSMEWRRSLSLGWRQERRRAGGGEAR